jgi:MoaA/NifB/PqqE/SkfB family radical SAM enzyme
MKAKEFIFKKAVDVIINQKVIRNFTAKELDKYMYKKFYHDDKNPVNIRMCRYQFFSSVLHTAIRNLDKNYYSKVGVSKFIKVLVGDKLAVDTSEKNKEVHERYKSQYGEYPPTFIVLSPTQRCNLRCTGCYAGSDSSTVPTLSYSTVDKIINDVYNIFGRKFIVISGGEPFLYKSEGKTLLDIFKKYNDIDFLVYTNGTLISKEIAQKLSELGNVTPAISVEGYESETDERRGKGVFKKILQAFDNLRTAGVPFGISVTVTSKNYELLLTDEFYDFYFEKQGASYMWQFQFMPIGRGKETFDLVVEPEKRIELYKVWKRLLEVKRYPVADFWNSALLSNGCIAYGNDSGYMYIDWNGNIMPCVFVPYYEDNIIELYKEGKNLADATTSQLMNRGRKWKCEYLSSDNHNYLMPCSIRDHYENFIHNILTKDSKPQNKQAEEAINDKKFHQLLNEYDKDLERLSQEVIDNETDKF